MAAKNINTQEFQELNHSGKSILVDFWAPWCGYCRRIGPAMDKIAAEYASDIEVDKINIDEEPLLAHMENIEVIPTLVLYRNGASVSSIVAPESKAMIDGFIRESMSK